MAQVNVIGAGAWGTALGIAAYRADNDVLLWTIDGLTVKAVNESHSNPFLPGIDLPEDVQATADLEEAVKADVLLMVVPVQFMASVCEQMQEAGLGEDVPLVICSKGIERSTHRLVSEILGEFFPNNPVGVISGPNFADEVAKGMPAATTLACVDKELGMQLVDILGSKTFRTYYSPDVVAAQLGGAVKNVLAIACGVSLGKKFGENTRVAIVSRGITEIARLCKAMGGKEESLLGLAGLGDMMLTCGSPKSRNMSLGMQLGEGKKLEEILADGKTVEGVWTAESVSELAQKLGVEMPICEAVNTVLHQGVSIDDAINDLLSRPLTVELG